MSRILIVDDDPDFVETTRIVLEQKGHETLSAASGDECLEVTRAQKPDLIILDVIMSSIRRLERKPGTAGRSGMQGHSHRDGHIHRQHGLCGTVPYRRKTCTLTPF